MKLRTLASMVLILCMGSTLVACTSPSKQQHFDAYVGTKNNNGANFRTVGEAIAAAPDDDGAYAIFVGPGEYKEKLKITRNNLHITGAGTDKTEIYFDDFAGRIYPGETKKVGTTGSASITIKSVDVSFKHLRISNRFDYLANDALSKDDPNYQSSTQAVALKLDKSSDRIAFYDVELLGYQDTVYTDGNRSVFIKSTIKGNVDFIFGKGNSLFYQSDLVMLRRARPVDVVGYVTAPSTNIQSEFGLTFINCRFNKGEAVAKNTAFFGRPWHPTTNFADGRYADPDAIGKTVILQSFIDDHINPAGWASMPGTAKDGGPKTIFTPESSRFFEFENIGPGAVKNSDRRQLTKEQAAQYTMDNILGDWADTVINEAYNSLGVSL